MYIDILAMCISHWLVLETHGESKPHRCTLSRTEKFIWPSYAIFMAKEMETHGEFGSFSQHFHAPPGTSSPMRNWRPSLVVPFRPSWQAQSSGAWGILVGPWSPCYQLPHDVRFVLVGQCEADPRPSSFAPGSHGVKCKLCWNEKLTEMSDDSLGACM